MDRLLGVAPNFLLNALWALEFGLHIYGEIYDWEKFSSSYSIIVFGVVLLMSGAIVHMICHKSHTYAHKRADEIQSVITSGVFSKIRHPMYLSIMMILWGMYIAWNFIVILPLPILITLLLYVLAKREERYLLEHLGDEYKRYMSSVHWMFIPGVI